MKDIGDYKQCPYCGYHTDSPQISPYLPIRTVIANKYLIGKLIDYNGDGATYMGWDLSRKKAVNVREFLPDAIATRKENETGISIMPGCEITFRDCYQSFLELWRKLVRLNGLSALISVVDVVEDLGTVYAVFEYTEGITLREYLLKTNTGYISWEKARQLFMPVLSTLGSLHSSGIIHRGISPTTLIVGIDGKVRISGFSIWQARTASGDLTAQFFNGYAAIEQYGFEGQQGAWTDIYAFGAVLYRALIGSDPIDAKSRAINDRLMVPGKFAEQLPAYVINGLINALQIMPEERTHTVEQLRAELSASPTAAIAGEIFEATGKFPARQATQTGIEAQTVKRKAEAEKLAIEKKKRNILILKTCGISLAVGLLLFLILALTVFRGTFRGNDSDSAESTSQVNTTAGDQFFIVPQFAGQPYSRFSSQAVWAERFVLDVTYEFSDKVESGIIISQSVAAETEVKKGARIMLVVSKGVEQITMIDIVGLTYDAAEQKLTELGFECVVNEQENDGTHLESVVISANLEVGKSYPKGTKVYIKIWGKTPTEAMASNESDDDMLRGIFDLFD